MFITWGLLLSVCRRASPGSRTCPDWDMFTLKKVQGNRKEQTRSYSLSHSCFFVSPPYHHYRCHQFIIFRLSPIKNVLLFVCVCVVFVVEKANAEPPPWRLNVVLSLPTGDCRQLQNASRHSFSLPFLFPLILLSSLLFSLSPSPPLS